MHELGIIAQVVKIAKKTAEANNLTKINKIVLQVGELSGAVPLYVERGVPAVVYNTPMQDCELKVEEVTAYGVCEDCRHEFPIVKCEGKCPKCHSDKFNIISGTQFIIKEIVAS